MYICICICREIVLFRDQSMRPGKILQGENINSAESHTEGLGSSDQYI